MEFHASQCEYMSRQAGEAPHGLNIPNALEFQIVHGHNRADTAEERVILEHFMQEYRNQRRLPVVAVDNVRTESYDRQHRQHGLGEKAEFLNIPQNITVQPLSLEEMFIVDVIIANAVKLTGHDADVEISQFSQIHIEAVEIGESAAILLRNAGVIRNDYAHIVFVFIQRFRKRSDNIRQAARLDKRHALRCCKQYILHNRFPPFG